jgi:hypothetical protein
MIGGAEHISILQDFSIFNIIPGWMRGLWEVGGGCKTKQAYNQTQTYVSQSTRVGLVQ